MPNENNNAYAEARQRRKDAEQQRRLMRQYYAESTFGTNLKSRVGAEGPWQIMPITQKDYLTRGKGKKGDVYDYDYAKQIRDFALDTVSRDLGSYWKDDSPENINLMKRYAGYNMGGRSLKNALIKAEKNGIDVYGSDAWLDYIPTETRNYVNWIVNGRDIDGTALTLDNYRKAWGQYRTDPFIEDIALPNDYMNNLLKRIIAAGTYATSHIKKEANRPAFYGIRSMREIIDSVRAKHQQPQRPTFFDIFNRVAAASGNTFDVGGPKKKIASTSPLADMREREKPRIVFGGGKFGGSGASGHWGDAEPVDTTQYIRNTPIFDERTFGQAYAAARKAGLDRFIFDGQEYTTDYDPEAVIVGRHTELFPALNIREVLDENQRAIADSTRIEPYIGQIVGVRERGKERGFVLPAVTGEKTFGPDDIAYASFLRTLPDNQRYTDENMYSMRRYWELKGRPKDFEEAKGLGMFTLDDSDGMYHANTIAWGDDGIGYFMKSKDHDALNYELDWYNSDDPNAVDFRNKYDLDTSGDFYRYIPKAKGGKIRIKPENRGKFTALKKRTGKSASWFKAHGTPAQRKMATFALNAKKWKHGDGGLLDRMEAAYDNDYTKIMELIQKVKASR